MVGVMPGAAEVLGSVSAGVGHATGQDEFLSPQKYDGTAFSLSLDTWSGRSGERMFPYIHAHNSLLFSSMNNEVGTGSMLQFMLDSDWMWSWTAKRTPMDDLFVGPAAVASVGALWNRRNSNNPANIEGFIALGAGVDNTFRFKIRSFPMALQTSLFMPLAGIGFAPDYDQPYWVMYTGKQYARTLHFVHPFNNPSLNYDMALYVPVGGNQLRLDWNAGFNSNRLGNNRTRISHNTFNLGFTYRLEHKYNGR